jgi:hypothetical protein
MHFGGGPVKVEIRGCRRAQMPSTKLEQLVPPLAMATS